MPKFRTCICVLAISLAPCLRAQVSDFDTASPSGTVISGTVLDATGKPVANAFMRVMPPIGTKVTARTDENGKYSLTVGPRPDGIQTISVVAQSADQHFSTAQQIDETKINIDLHLKPSIYLALKAQDPEGNPITNATARISIRSGNSTIPLSPTFTPGGLMAGKSDTNGQYEFEAVPEVGYTITLNAEGYGSASQRVLADAVQGNRYDFPAFILKKADKALAGRVLDNSGHPMAGTSVRISGSGQPVGVTGQTDTNGYFRLDGVGAGPLRVQALPQGGGPSTSVAATGGDTNVEIRFAQEVSGFAASAQSVTTITGSVFDENGKAVTNAALRILPPIGVQNREVMSDEKGRYSLTSTRRNVGNQSFFIVARTTDGRLGGIDRIDETTTNVDLRLKSNLVVGITVEDTAGQPISNATAGSLTLRIGNTSMGIGARGPANTIATPPHRLDSAGHYQLEALPGIGYDITMAARGYGTARHRIETFTLAGINYDLPPFVLKKADLTFAGTVLDTNGNPVAGVRVSINGDGQPNGSTETDSKGRFSFEGVCEGVIRVNAFPPPEEGGSAASADGVGGDTNLVVRFRRDNSAATRVGGVNVLGAGQVAQRDLLKVSGIVRDANGKPVPNTRLTVEPPQGFDTEAMSDEAGRYSLEWTPAQNGNQTSSSYIVAGNSDLHLAVAHILDEKATNLDLRLEPMVRIALKVVDPDGKPIPKATANLVVNFGNWGVGLGQEDDSPVIGQLPAGTDEQGRYEFEGVRGVGYSITMTAKGYASINPRVDAEEIRGARFDFPAFVLKKADRVVSGTVVDMDGKPVIYAQVNINGDGQRYKRTLADSRGKFKISGVSEGFVTVSAFPPGGGMGANKTVLAGDTNVSLRIAAALTQNQPANMSMVSGTVFDADGKPAGGVLITFNPDPGMNDNIVSDPDGTYSLGWQWGMFGGNVASFLVARDEDRNLAVAQPIDVKTTNMDLHLAPGIKITGSVQAPNAKGIRNVSVRLTVNNGNFSTTGGMDPVITDASGVFEFKALPPNFQYSINVSAHGYGQVNRGLGQAQGGALQVPPIILKPADLRLAGRVLDTDDRPAAGARVSVGAEGQPSATTICDALGRFALKVCEGNVSVSASIPQRAQNGGWIANPGTANVKGGDTNVIIKIGVNDYFETIKREAATGPG